MGEVTVALYVALALVGFTLAAIGALRRVPILRAAGTALLVGLAGAWIVGLPGAALGVVALVIFLARGRS